MVLDEPVVQGELQVMDILVVLQDIIVVSYLPHGVCLLLHLLERKLVERDEMQEMDEQVLLVLSDEQEVSDEQDDLEAFVLYEDLSGIISELYNLSRIHLLIYRSHDEMEV